MLDLTLAHKIKIRFTKISQIPRRHSVGAWNTIYFLSFTCIFRNFQKLLNAKLFGISKISCYHLKGDSESFSQKNQRCPKFTHKLPISPFSKYNKNRTISPFSPIFWRNSKNPNHRMLDLTLAHKMKIRFTNISQSPRCHSVGAWNTI